MSVLIADSGATNTTWALIDATDQKVVQTSGMNPQLKVDRELESVVFDELIPNIDKNGLSQIFFYGAGTSNKYESQRIDRLLKEAFINREVYVKSDIEGAGLAVFGDSDGIVVISGTGSSAGFMSDGQLESTLNARAFPEGDFGSGSHIGSLILKDYFDDSAPETIKDLIDENRKLSIEELFIQFQDPKKSKMIAAKAMKDIATLSDLSGLMHEEYLKGVVSSSLGLLLSQLKQKFGFQLSEYSVRFIGSTAWYFQNIFNQVFETEGLRIDHFERSPINGLINYHRKKL